MQSLGQDDAVELVSGELGRLGEVCYNCGQRIILCNIQHLAFFDPRAAVAQGVRIITYLENTSLNIFRMLFQELLNVIPVNRDATVITPLPADGLEWPITERP